MSAVLPPTHSLPSLFASVQMAERDPILGLNEQFNADTRSTKVNLGVGVYFTDEGKIPLLRAVAAAEKLRFEAHAARGYLPIEGLQSTTRRYKIYYLVQIALSSELGVRLLSKL